MQLTRPAILVVVGASGAGKSTLVRALAAESLPGVRCLEFDTIGVPSAEEIARRWGDGGAWQAWALGEWFTRIARDHADVAVVVLDAQVRPSAVRDVAERMRVPRAHSILVDCDYAERNARLRGPRAQPELATPLMDTWAAYLRGQADALGLPIIDTTHASVAESVDALRAHARTLLDEP